LTDTPYVRLVSHEEKGAVLADAGAAVREGNTLSGIFLSVEPASFPQIPGAAFAYWAGERARRFIPEVLPFERDGRTVKHGERRLQIHLIRPATPSP
jgi:hypothetical protein